MQDLAALLRSWKQFQMTSRSRSPGSFAGNVEIAEAMDL